MTAGTTADTTPTKREAGPAQDCFSSCFVFQSVSCSPESSWSLESLTSHDFSRSDPCHLLRYRRYVHSFLGMHFTAPSFTFLLWFTENILSQNIVCLNCLSRILPAATSMFDFMWMSLTIIKKMPPCLKAAQVTFALEHKTGFFQLKETLNEEFCTDLTHNLLSFGTFLRATAFLSSGVDMAQTLVFMGIKDHFSHRNMKKIMSHKYVYDSVMLMVLNVINFTIITIIGWQVCCTLTKFVWSK